MTELMILVLCLWVAWAELRLSTTRHTVARLAQTVEDFARAHHKALTELGHIVAAHELSIKEKEVSQK